MTARIDHQRAVKKYHRPAAGNEAPLPEDVRPPSVLRRTMDYLLAVLDTPDDRFSFSDKHKFLRDRTRSIRQDIILQQRAIHRDPQALFTVVRLHEEMARFHILSGHRLCEMDFSDFDPFQNTEQLRKVLQSLQEFYTDIRVMLNRSSSSWDPQSSGILREALQNEAEFRSYVLLTHAEDQDVFRQSLSFPPEIFEAPTVQLALLCVSTLHRGEYVAYFRQVTSGATYLQACLLQTHFVRVRQRALQVLTKAYTVKELLPAALLMRWLLLTDEDELISALSYQKSYLRYTANGQMIEWGNLNGDSRNTDDISFDATPVDDVASSLSATPAVKARTNRYIEEKVAGLSSSQIIYGCGTAGEVALNVTPDTRGAGRGTPTKSVPSTMESAVVPRTTICPPSVSSPNFDEVTRRLAEELLSWCIYQELLPELTQRALNREHTRRATLKAHTIDAVLSVLWEMIIGEFIGEVCIHQLALGRERLVSEAYREQCVRKIAGDLSEQILSEVVRGSIDEQQQISRSLMQTLMMVSSQPSTHSLGWSSKHSAGLSPSSSVMTTPGARKRRLLAHSKVLEMCTLESVVFGSGDAPSTFTDQLGQLAMSASSERLASQHLDDLIRKATAM